MQITVRDRIAAADGAPFLVCGNSGETVTFRFDAEWDAFPQKTAYFSYFRDGACHVEKAVFTGETVEIPVLRSVYEVMIGVRAGNVQTTAAVRIPCLPCITDIPAKPAQHTPDVYHQVCGQLADIFCRKALRSWQTIHVLTWDNLRRYKWKDGGA